MDHPLLTAITGYHSTILEHEHTVLIHAVLERPQKVVEPCPQLASWQHAGSQHKTHKNDKLSSGTMAQTFVLGIERLSLRFMQARRFIFKGSMHLVVYPFAYYYFPRRTGVMSYVHWLFFSPATFLLSGYFSHSHVQIGRHFQESSFHG